MSGRGFNSRHLHPYHVVRHSTQCYHVNAKAPTSLLVRGLRIDVGVAAERRVPDHVMFTRPEVEPAERASTFTLTGCSPALTAQQHAPGLKKPRQNASVQESPH